MQTFVYFLLTKKKKTFWKKTKPCLQNMTLNINLSVYGGRIFISEHLQSMIINAQTKSKADQMNYLHQTDTINYLPVAQTNLHFVLRKQNQILSQTRKQKKIGARLFIDVSDILFMIFIRARLTLVGQFGSGILRVSLSKVSVSAINQD